MVFAKSNLSEKVGETFCQTSETYKSKSLAGHKFYLSPNSALNWYKLDGWMDRYEYS